MIKNISLILLFMSLLSLQVSALEDREIKVAFAQDSFDSELRLTQVESLSEALQNYPNIKLLKSDADSSISMQIMQIEDFIREGVDVLIISPLDENVTTKVIQRAYDYHVPIILINKELNNSKFTHYVQTDESNTTNQTQQIVDSILNILKEEGVYDE